ncbi:MAG: exodeoxyribonuclease VII large subunit [Erysipelotrichaceae bacterium]|nr:exodeoxyribonuclease VII large subunit [Erysipelotrichaceae bacterium]
MNQEYMSVYALNRYVKQIISSDIELQDVYLKGEVSNYRPHPSGHMYFTLKDDKASIRAIMFNNAAKNLNFKLEDGMKVLIRCYVTLYEKTGSYQITVREMQQDGIGNLYYQFEMLKKKLTEQGYFDEAHKKPIPAFPRHIAVLSARQGDALQDVLRTLKERYPVARVYIYPIPVQGKDAYKVIIRTLQGIDHIGFSTILLVRGGGSIEELWNFNEEELVKCIYEMNTPVITGVGHELDMTLVDFVSDYRANTPTGAAVAATPNIKELQTRTDQASLQLNRIMKQKISLERSRLNQYAKHYILTNPEQLYSSEIIRITALKDKFSAIGTHLLTIHQHDLLDAKAKLNRSIKQIVDNNSKDLNTYNENLNRSLSVIVKQKRQSFNHSVEKLDLVNPLKLLTKGYSIVKYQDHVVKQSAELKQGDDITIMFSDGQHEATIK